MALMNGDMREDERIVPFAIGILVGEWVADGVEDVDNRDVFDTRGVSEEEDDDFEVEVGVGFEVDFEDVEGMRVCVGSGVECVEMSS